LVSAQEYSFLIANTISPFFSATGVSFTEELLLLLL